MTHTLLRAEDLNEIIIDAEMKKMDEVARNPSRGDGSNQQGGARCRREWSQTD
jgi:hypothetical protein